MAKNNVYNFIRVKGDEEEVKRMMAAVTVMTDEGIRASLGVTSVIAKVSFPPPPIIYKFFVQNICF